MQINYFPSERTLLGRVGDWLWVEPEPKALLLAASTAASDGNTYHSQRLVIAHFREHFLLHRSGDYRWLAPIAVPRCLFAIADLTRRERGPQSRLHGWAVRKLLHYKWDYYSMEGTAYD